jgi:hypothetical protein
MVLVVAEASTDGDFVTTLGTSAAQYGCASLGLHPGKKPVGLRAVATVGLKGTLRHLTRLLLNFFAVCNSLSVYLKGPLLPNRTSMQGFTEAASQRAELDPNRHAKAFSIGPSQGMVQPNFLSLIGLKSTWFSVLLSNPLTKHEIGFIEIVLWFTLSFLFAKGAKPSTKTSSKQHLSPIAYRAMQDFCCLCISDASKPVGQSVISNQEKTWDPIQEGI